MAVSTLPKSNGLKDEAQNHIVPLTVSGLPEELDAGFLQTVARPILGICRGLQVLNVALGGTLIQDLGDALRPFHQGERDLWHPICTAPGSLLHRLWGSRILINSAHHQAADRLGDGLRRTAWSEGGVTEAVEHSCLPVAAVQFHPERLDRTGEDTADGAPLFRWLTARAAG